MGFVSGKLQEVFESIIIFLFGSFLGPFDEMPTLKNLVFGKAGEDSLVWSTFTADELTNALGPLFFTMSVLAGFFFVGFIALYGIRIAGAPVNPNTRNQVIEFLKDLLIVGVIFINLPIIYDLIFSVNSSIVGMFNSAFDAESMSGMDKIGVDDLDKEGGFLGGIFIQLILLGLMVWANFYYMMRKLTLIILMSLGPLMMVFWLHPQFKPMTGSWLKELIGSVFVQAIHALVFWSISIISVNTTGFIGPVILYLVFIPISESIRRLLMMGGDMQGGLAKAGSMMGMAGLAGMYGAAKGAFNGNGVAGTFRGAYQGAKDAPKGEGKDHEKDGLSPTMAAKVGGDEGSTGRADQMLRAGDIVGRMGKATLGAAGAIAGSGLGPVGAMAGASGGFAIGGAVGGVTGRAGAAALQGISSKLQDGKEALQAMKDGRSKDFDDELASLTADKETASWADSHKESSMQSLRERFPDASPSELESKFDDMKEKKRAEFYNAAKQNIQSVRDSDLSKASGNSMVSASAAAMATQWESDNGDTFLENYDRENPQKAGESSQQFNQRRQQALASKKAEMKSAFTNAGNEYVAQQAADGHEPISKEGFANYMSGFANSIDPVNGKSLAQASSAAIDHMQGAQVFDKQGKPNAQFLASSLANAKTIKMGEEYVSSQVASGVSQAAAEKDWVTNHQTKAHAGNLRSYNDSVASASSSAFGSNISTSALKNATQTVGAFASGALTSKTIGAATETLQSAAQAGLATHMSLKTEGSGTVANLVKTAGPSAKASWQGAMSNIQDRSGGAVEAHANLQNNVGYASGVLFGANSYQKGKSLANRFSPHRKQMQSEIHSPGEVIQMARTTTDYNGNTQVASGAIRQVTTADSSYIEVTTKGGEKKIVSRKGSGHSGLKKGDVVYQDYNVVDDQLVPVTLEGGSSTYRLDSAGARVASTVEIASPPSTLLGNPRISESHKALNRKEAPVYSQAVDSGSFYTNDLAVNGFDNVQVVIEKGRQYVTGDLGGETYRVSQITSGDARLGDETVRIPVEVSSNEIRPTYSADSAVAVEAIIQRNGTSENAPYYSSANIEEIIGNLDELIPSKHMARTRRSLEQRKRMDELRRKQGFMG